MQNWPMARYHFLMAEDQGMNTKVVGENKKLVEEKLEIERLEKASGASDYFIKGSLVASEGPLTSLGLLLLVIGLWILKKTPTFKKAMLFLAIVMMPLALNFWIESWPKKIVTETKVVYAGPSAIFETVGEIPEGIMVLTDSKGEWEKIVYPSRFTGWIKSEGLKRLK